MVEYPQDLVLIVPAFLVFFYCVVKNRGLEQKAKKNENNI